MLVEMMYAVPVAGKLGKKERKKLNKKLPKDFKIRLAGSSSSHRLLLCYKPADTFVASKTKVNKHLQPYTSINRWTERHKTAINHSDFIKVENKLARVGLALPERSQLWQWYLVIDS